MTYQIQNMTCGGCVRHVTEAIKGVDPEATVTVDLHQRTAEVESKAPETEILRALEEEGYPAKKV